MTTASTAAAGTLLAGVRSERLVGHGARARLRTTPTWC